METDLLSIALHAGAEMFVPERLMYLCFGVFIGLGLGVIPGLGGLVGLTMLLPFTFSMDTMTAMAFLLGLLSVTATSDTIPAVMFGVPGTVAAQATIVDGYPMARQGRGAEALGAAFSASLIGGLFGAVILGISIPILRPFMLQLATPELLGVVLVGLALVSVLAGKSPMKGIAMCCVGLLISAVGEDSQTGALRWTFGTAYLYDGVPLPIVALGIFAIPEMATLVLGRVVISRNFQKTGLMDQMVGVRATFRNWFLVLRCSSIGALIGAMPGVGSSVLDWITYAHARSTEKGAGESFGKGDVRGVIAPESANNANQGGALVPTIAFGIPGGAAMAILLGAFIIHGIYPGPEMLTEHLDITYGMVWTVALANILGAGICFLAAGYLARLALVPIYLLAPIVLSLVFIGAYQSSNNWGDIIALFGFGALGLVMKLMGWPRPPLILGFVLGSVAERYMFISLSRYGWEWTTRPITFVLLVMAAFFLLQPLYKALTGLIRNRRAAAAAVPAGDTAAPAPLFRPRLQLDATTGFLIPVAVLFVAVLVSASGWSFYARIYPTIIAWTGLAAILFLLIGRMVFAAADHGSGGMDVGNEDVAGLSRSELYGRMAQFAGLLAVFGIAGPVIGFLPGLAVFITAFVRVIGGKTWGRSLMIGALFLLLSYVLFHHGLRLFWPESVIGHLFPQLRLSRMTAIF